MLTPVSQLRCLIAAIPCPLVDLVDGGLLIEQTKSMFFLWVKQCHKPSMTGNGLYLPPLWCFAGWFVIVLEPFFCISEMEPNRLVDFSPKNPKDIDLSIQSGYIASGFFVT